MNSTETCVYTALEPYKPTEKEYDYITDQIPQRLFKRMEEAQNRIQLVQACDAVTSWVRHHKDRLIKEASCQT